VHRPDQAAILICNSATRRCGIELQNIRKGDHISFDIRETPKRPGRFEATDIALIA